MLKIINLITKIFNILKHDILTEIETVKENPKLYSMVKMLENMDYSMPYAYHGYGYLEDLDK